jgi:hypothetical protein
MCVDQSRHLEHVLAMSAYHLHLGTLATFLINYLEPQIQAIDEELSPQMAPSGNLVPA